MPKSNAVGPSLLGLTALGLLLAGSAQAQEAFTNWNAVVKPGATIAVGGVSQEFTYTSGASGVTSVAPPSTNMAVMFTQTLNETGDITSVVLKNANRTVGFYKANGDTITAIGAGQLIYSRASDWTRQALAVDALGMGWAYQTFSVWQEGLGLPNGSMGAASVGAITAGTSVPQTGSATFYGLMAGIYNDSAGQDHVISADMLLGVNFAAHAANFRTFNTVDRYGVDYRILDITGTFVSLPNHPALFGTLNTSRLTGTSSAQFYGPAAEEVGGVFTLTPKTGTGLERLAGAFGGRRGTAGGGAFASWTAALQAGVTITVAGKSQEVSVTGGVNGVTAVTATPVADTTYTETISTEGYTTGMSYGTRNGPLAFNTANGDLIVGLSDPRVFAAVSSDQTRIAIAAEPIELGWNYQSFGVWQSTDGAATGRGGVVSVGAATPGTSIPTAGSATFKGVVGGIYIDPTGRDHIATSDMTLATDFAQRRATFASGSLVDMFETATYDGTGLSGALTYAAGQNQLTGTLTTASGRLSGVATGQFYGPLAQEVGGTFVLAPTGAGVERLIGGFGAKR